MLIKTFLPTRLSWVTFEPYWKAYDVQPGPRVGVLNFDSEHDYPVQFMVEADIS